MGTWGMGEKRGKAWDRYRAEQGVGLQGEVGEGDASTSLSQFPQAQLQKQPPCRGSFHCVSVKEQRQEVSVLATNTLREGDRRSLWGLTPPESLLVEQQ